MRTPLLLILSIYSTLAVARVTVTKEDPHKEHKEHTEKYSEKYGPPANISNELGVSSLAYVDVQTPVSGSTGTATVTTIDIEGGYHYSLERNFQLGASFAFQTGFSGSSTTSIATEASVNVAPTFTFGGDDLRSDFYIRPGVNFTVTTGTGTTSTAWGAQVSAGKRFMLLENLSYTPNVDVFVPISVSGGTEVTLNIFALAAFW